MGSPSSERAITSATCTRLLRRAASTSTRSAARSCSAWAACPLSACSSAWVRTSSSTTASRRRCEPPSGCGAAGATGAPKLCPPNAALPEPWDSAGPVTPGEGPMVGGRGMAGVAALPKKAGESVGSVVGAGGKPPPGGSEAGPAGVRLKGCAGEAVRGGLLLPRERRARKSATSLPSASPGKCATRPVRKSADRSCCSRPLPYTITWVSKYCSRPCVKVTPE